ncbi:MAG TPA: DEAD/DEAH box helicase family protein [Acidimicrobiales bacterium]|nr:DEAD/DEAH box helicase family protein [Acidimicrobiales bacterium]
MARTVRLRPWQKAALDLLDRRAGADFLAVATPGAGKTTFALTAVRRALADTPTRRVVVVVPTQHLKVQWASAAAAFDLHLQPEWSARDGRLPADVHGIVTTYQQVATSAGALNGLCRDAAVVFDEIHHAGEDKAWGDAVRQAFAPAAFRLALSGTPFRSDTSAIPFVTYVDGEATPDFEYGYGDALTDGGVVRPVYFPRLNGHMEWVASDGQIHSHRFDEALDPVKASQRLRTALSLDGDWLPTVLSRAHAQLESIRAVQPDAAGLVIASDQDHARGIADLLRRRIGADAVVATSDDPGSSARIAAFARSATPWLVAVRMVSEGVDIPRLRVGVFATTTTTELFFRQAVGRLVRWTAASPAQRAYLFIPDDARLRARAVAIAEQRRHSLRRRVAREAHHASAREPETGDDEQLSLFAAISAVPVGDVEQHEWLPDDGDTWGPADDAAGELTIELAPAPVLAGRRGAPFGLGSLAPVAGETLAERRRRLREANAGRVRDLVHRTGMSHAKVNAELNRMAGVARVTEATAEQLERRLRRADAWLLRL